MILFNFLFLELGGMMVKGRNICFLKVFDELDYYRSDECGVLSEDLGFFVKVFCCFTVPPVVNGGHIWHHRFGRFDLIIYIDLLEDSKYSKYAHVAAIW